jgi:hypothetical protein
VRGARKRLIKAERFIETFASFIIVIDIQDRLLDALFFQVDKAFRANGAADAFA